MLYYHLHGPVMNMICVMEPGLTVIDVHETKLRALSTSTGNYTAVKSALRTNDLVQDQRYDEVVTEGQHVILARGFHHDPRE